MGRACCIRPSTCCRTCCCTCWLCSRTVPVGAGGAAPPGTAGSCSEGTGVRVAASCFLARTPTMASATTRPTNPKTARISDLRVACGLGHHAQPLHPLRQRLGIGITLQVLRVHGGMGFGPMLVELELALQRYHL